MKLTTPKYLLVLAILTSGFAHAHDNSLSEHSADKPIMTMSREDYLMKHLKAGSESMDHDKMDHDKMDPVMKESEGSDQAKTGSKHDHRKFKGLPSARSSSDDEQEHTQDDDKEGHNHRKQHK